MAVISAQHQAVASTKLIAPPASIPHFWRWSRNLLGVLSGLGRL
jgi:hypothetical protein